MMALSEYYEALANHNWYYEYADDHDVWISGSESLSQLIDASRTSDEHRLLYESYVAHIFKGAVKPKCPAYD
jgi:hypothetical protein